MRKISLRRSPILGLVLMAASAVTTAIIPDKKDDKSMNNNNGTLRPFSNSIGGPGGVFSCVFDVDVFFSCTASMLYTTTSVSDEEDSFDTQGIYQAQTTRNTSQTWAIPDGPDGVNQTSHVVVI